MSDLIDRQMAIDTLRRCKVIDVKNMLIARDDAMKSIMTLPSAQPEITLESAIDYLHSIGWMQEHDRIMVESAQPERKKGEWIIHNVLDRNCHPTNRHFAECSECGTLTREWRGNLFPPSLRFCTNCGADMRGEQDG